MEFRLDGGYGGFLVLYNGDINFRLYQWPFQEPPKYGLIWYSTSISGSWRSPIDWGSHWDFCLWDLPSGKLTVRP